MGYVLAQSWWLSDETTLSIRHNHNVETLNTHAIPPSMNSRLMIAIAQLAEHLLQQHSGLSITQEWIKLGPACLHLLKLNEEDVKELLSDAIPVIDAASLTSTAAANKAVPL